MAAVFANHGIGSLFAGTFPSSTSSIDVISYSAKTLNSITPNNPTSGCHLIPANIFCPTITCTGNKSLATTSGICTYTHATDSWNPTATDNIGVTSLTYSLSGVTSGSGTTLNGRLFNKGVTTVTWTAADASGNSKSCEFIVNVFDAESPVANCKNVTVTLDKTGHITVFPVTIDKGSYDNCGIENFKISGDLGVGYYDFLLFDRSDIGDQYIQLYVADEAGNTSSCSTIINIVDSQDLTPDDLSPKTLQVDDAHCTYTHPGPISNVSDNCGVSTSYRTATPTNYDSTAETEQTLTFAAVPDNANITIGSRTLFIPEGFSPNGDGINDYFVIEGAERFVVILRVFNRWGNKVFESGHYMNDWDGVSNVGILNTNQLPGGTYYYTVNFNNGEKKRIGYLTLNR